MWPPGGTRPRQGELARMASALESLDRLLAQRRPVLLLALWREQALERLQRSPPSKTSSAAPRRS